MQVELKKCDDELAKLNDTKVQLENAIAKATEQFNAVELERKDSFRQQVIDGNKKLLTVLLNISKKEKEKADKKNQFEENILQQGNSQGSTIFYKTWRHAGLAW